jgi:hypothetical protein
MVGRTIAIADIHGCAAALAALVEAIRPGPNDTLVTLERFAGGCSGECVPLAAVPGGPAVPSGVAQGPAQAPQGLTATKCPLCHELFRGTAGARYAQPQSALGDYIDRGADSKGCSTG